MITAETIAATIRAVLDERKLYIVKPQHPTMGEVALEAYGFGKACDAVALQGDELAALIADIAARCMSQPVTADTITDGEILALREDIILRRDLDKNRETFAMIDSALNPLCNEARKREARGRLADILNATRAAS